MPGAHRPADFSRGDPNTLGGYMAVHDRPAAFEGPDGHAYSIAIETDRTADPARPWGAFLLFLRWRRTGEQGIEGHLESDFLAGGATPDDARIAAGRIPLSEVRRLLDQLVRLRAPAERPLRAWWDAMREEDGAAEGGAPEAAAPDGPDARDAARRDADADGESR